jgi:hypothetical protein
MRHAVKIVVSALAVAATVVVWSGRVGGAPPPKGIELTHIGTYTATDGSGGSAPSLVEKRSGATLLRNDG